MGFISFIFQDKAQNAGNTKGKIITVLFRVGNYSRDKPIIRLLLIPYLVFYKLFVEWILGIEIPYNTEIGSGLKVLHGQGLVVNSNTKIGSNVSLKQNTTIGNSNSGGESPVLRDNVNVGANCVIIGNITVGSNSTLGAGAVVVKDVPEGSVVVGNPARIIRTQSVK